MTFGSPNSFLLILVVLIMAADVAWLLRWRRKARNDFAGPQAAAWPSSPFAWRMLLVLIAAVLIVIAAARPQWGSRQQLRESKGVDMVIALDVSQSMQGTDAQPTRLAVAQGEIKRLITAQRGSRIGLVFFAGSAAVRSPLTSDTGALSELVDRAGKETSLTKAGSDLSSALQQADMLLTGGETNAGKAIIIVSDGEDHAGNFIDKVTDLRNRGVGVYTAGVGTARGSQLFDLDSRGQPHLKLDANGQPVVTHLDEANLRDIAQAGGGRYVLLDGSGGSLLSFTDDLSRLNQAAFGIQTNTLPSERYQAFVIAALILLVESWALPTRLLIPAATKLRRIRPHPSLALVLVALFVGACGSSDALRGQNADANAQYQSGDYAGALKSYESLLAQRPDVPQLGYNAGNALHRMGNYDRAVTETQRALPPTDPKLGAETYYALGNHLLAQQRYEEAYDAYKSSLLLNPKDEDAKHNLEVTLQQYYASLQPGQTVQPGGIPMPQADQQAPQGQPGGAQPGQTGQGQGQQGPIAPGQPQSPAPASPNAQPSDQPSTLPPPPDASSGDAQRSLQDALKGLDQDISFEDAQKLLDLLRDQPVPKSPSAGTTSGPDY